jgi:methylenetetrahydrofolate--tRNA-(uracil-5-)-methyltransferase
MKPIINVIGAGLAGSEATYQLIKRGYQVRLFERRPKTSGPAHVTSDFAELVCSNSFRSDSITNAVGLLKEEMRLLDSLIMKMADIHRVEAGSALAVDRVGFSHEITQYLSHHPMVEVIVDEVSFIPEGPTIIATGPLTGDALAQSIAQFIGKESLYFYDAIAPIIEKDSIDFSKAFYKSRYDKGEASYINCGMNDEEYERFYDLLTQSENVPLKEFEKEIYFEGCMPVEEMARRGKETLLFGPLKPVGLEYEGQRFKAVIQLRQDNAAASLYNIVGFQTHLKWPDQKKVIQSIPGLENANIVRYGVMHRNTYINSPTVLNSYYQSKKREDLFFAGQMTGVEGYVESAASGLLAALNLMNFLEGKPLIGGHRLTMITSMADYVSQADPKHFAPMNANFGLVERSEKDRPKERNEKFAMRSLEIVRSFYE